MRRKSFEARRTCDVGRASPIGPRCQGQDLGPWVSLIDGGTGDVETTPFLQWTVWGRYDWKVCGSGLLPWLNKVRPRPITSPLRSCPDCPQVDIGLISLQALSLKRLGQPIGIAWICPFASLARFKRAGWGPVWSCFSPWGAP